MPTLTSPIWYGLRNTHYNYEYISLTLSPLYKLFFMCLCLTLCGMTSYVTNQFSKLLGLYLQYHFTLTFSFAFFPSTSLKSPAATLRHPSIPPPNRLLLIVDTIHNI